MQNFDVNILDADDQPVTVPYITLLAWREALSLEMKGMERSGPSVSSIVRRALSTSKTHPIEGLYQHIDLSIKDIKEQLQAA